MSTRGKVPAKTVSEAPGAQAQQQSGSDVLDGEWSMKDLTAILIRERGLHEGRFELTIKFLLSVSVLKLGDKTGPGSLAMIEGIGLRRASADNVLALDAAEVNPKAPPVEADSAQPRRARARPSPR